MRSPYMQIDDVIREIVTLGIPEDAERLKMMIVILGKYSQIEDNRVRLTKKKSMTWGGRINPY